MQTAVFAGTPILRGYWYAVAQSSDVAPGPLAVSVLGEPLVPWFTAEGALTAACVCVSRRRRQSELSRLRRG